MLSFNRKFGLGAPLKKRNIWSGADRAVRSIVGSYKDPFLLRPGGLSAAFQMIESNGADMYVVVLASVLQTSPDLITLTSRSAPAGYSWVGANVVYYKGYFFAFCTPGSGVAVCRSSDKGVTWDLYGSMAGNRLSVVGDLLYCTNSGATSNFYTTNAPTTAATARAFSRSAYWGRVVGSAARQYVFGSVSSDTTTFNRVEVSTNGTSFSQDAACEALLAQAPVSMRHAHALANGKTVVFGVGPEGLYSLVADAAGAWSIGAQIPGELADGYRLYGVPLVVGNAASALMQTDGDGTSYVCLIVQDAAGNYLLRIAATYDGVDWRFLPPHSNLGTTAPNFTAGVMKRIDGRIMTHYNSMRLVEANPSGVELYYEI